MSIVVRGPVKVLVNEMEKIRNILLREGFSDPAPLQTWKDGQVFGLVKKVTHMLEMHVRGYDDFTLESEIELSRGYLEHPYDCRPFYGPLLKILSRYRIPFTTRQLPKDPDLVTIPKNPTPWKPLLATAIVITFSVGLALLTSEPKKELERHRDEEDGLTRVWPRNVSVE